MKEREPETGWTSTVAWMYETGEDIVSRGGRGRIVKYLGDGMMLAHHNATDAINDAIAFQEVIADAVEERYVNFLCSYGIGSGKVLAFDDPRGNEDYLGLVADRAFRLCGAAAPQAIFLDIETVACAQLNRVASSVGTVLRRNLDDYLGELEQMALKGFAHPVRYREVRWAHELFGRRDGVPPRRPTRSSVMSSGPGGWVGGRWNP